MKNFSPYGKETGFVRDEGNPPITVDLDGAQMRSNASWLNPGFAQTENDPVVCVSFQVASAFCRWLTQREKASLPAGAFYRLPTDDEWSKACGSSIYPWGNSFPPTHRDGNFAGAESRTGREPPNWESIKELRDGFPRTSPAGSFKPNGFGLYDMGGNVWEWCDTWYSADMNSAAVKARFPFLLDDHGGRTYRVLRGGSWYDAPDLALRSASRNTLHPTFSTNCYGFRCVLALPRPPAAAGPEAGTIRPR